MQVSAWQLVMICWGTKYGVEDINRLHDAAQKHSPSLTRSVLITDRERPGLRPGIETRRFPEVFLDDTFKGPGCQAKLSMFSKGLMPTDVPAVYCDLDSIVLGDLSEILNAQTDGQIGILQSTYLPASRITRAMHLLSGRKIYARGNSSIVAFHPKFHSNIAEAFLRLYQDHGFGFKPLRADERFISWSAQRHLRFIHPRQAVKFTREFMGNSIGEVRARAALPSTITRRKALIFITFNQDAIKPSRFATFADGTRIKDSKGRITEWSDAALGVHKKIFKQYFSDPPALSESKAVD